MTNVEIDKDKINYFVHIHLIKLMRTEEILKEMKDDFENAYKPLGAQIDDDRKFSSNFIINSIKQERFQACVCKINSKFYRTELIGMSDDYEKFNVRLVDFGTEESVDIDSIFRPIVKYISIDRQAFKIKINCKTRDIQQVKFLLTKNGFQHFSVFMSK